MIPVPRITTMLRIYDDAHLRRRFTLKRTQMLMLFAGGAASGLWLAHDGIALADAATAAPAPLAPMVARWCSDDTPGGLRLDCGLSLPQPADAASR